MSTPAPYSLTVPEREASTSAQQRTRTPTLVLPESPLDSRYPPFTASSNLPSSSLAGSASSAPRAGLLTQADAFGNSSSYSLAPSQIPGSAHFLENDPEDGERDTFLGQDSYNEPGTFARSVEHRNNSAASRRRDIIDGVSLREAHRRDVLDGLSLREARLQAPRPVTLAVIPRASGFQEGYTPAALADASPFVAEDSELRGVYIPEENGDTIRARRRGGAETVNQVDNAGGIALQADDQTTSYEPSKEKVSSTQAREPATAGGMVEVPDVPGDTDHDRSNTGCKIERDDTRKSMVPWSRSLDKFHPAFRDETSKTPSIRSSLRSSDSDIRSPEGGWDIPLRTRHTRQQEITPPSAPQGAPANAYNRPPLIPNRNEPSPFGAYGSFSRMEDDAVSESGLTSRICDEYLQNTAELPERYLQHFTRDSHPYPQFVGHPGGDVTLQSLPSVAFQSPFAGRGPSTEGQGASGSSRTRAQTDSRVGTLGSPPHADRTRRNTTPARFLHYGADDVNHSLVAHNQPLGPNHQHNTSQDLEAALQRHQRAQREHVVARLRSGSLRDAVIQPQQGRCGCHSKMLIFWLVIAVAMVIAVAAIIGVMAGR